MVFAAFTQLLVVLRNRGGLGAYREGVIAGDGNRIDEVSDFPGRMFSRPLGEGGDEDTTRREGLSMCFLNDDLAIGVSRSGLLCVRWAEIPGKSLPYSRYSMSNFLGSYVWIASSSWVG